MTLRACLEAVVRKCARCQVDQPLRQYYAKFSTCKACARIMNKAWRHANPDEVMKHE